MDLQILSHLEASLGLASATWERDSKGPLTVPLAKFAAPFDGAVTYSTVGLSRHVLHQVDYPDLRQELMMSTWARFDTPEILGRLEDLAENAIRIKQAYMRGEARDFGDPVLPGIDLTGLFMATPVYFPKDLKLITGRYRELVVFFWVIPVSSAEAAYCHSQGWEALEDIFVKENPDLLDLSRPSVV